ncbi:hypothetical protein [Halococcus hamelinensis]|uniref:Rpa-associated protein n=1 Tax=Halococcus hamelinensis 100A6 TaxID=1132509 RepID=M0M0A6_9EURY|nr:hypothetical protein [Halococcus hamelinensis]EMA39101.1 hypothetical protein C447_08088 [Halococcus hamelinensis 100A6]
MSTTPRPERETAYRLFAAEFDDASLSYAESDEERAPNYVVTPTGARVNRLFAVGVLTEIEAVNDSQLRARVVDPTGAFVVYAGQYQPEALSFLESASPPAFVAVTGKARTFQPEDSDRVFTSVRPETLSEVDASTRDRFVVDTAERTTERVATMREALSRAERDDDLRTALEDEGTEIGLAAGVPRAIAHYGTTAEYLDAVETMALDAAGVVAGEREEVAPLDVPPGTGSVEGSTERTTSTGTDESATAEGVDSTGETDSAGVTDSTDGTDSVDSSTATTAIEDDSGSGVEADDAATTSEDGTEPDVEAVEGEVTTGSETDTESNVGTDDAATTADDGEPAIDVESEPDAEPADDSPSEVETDSDGEAVTGAEPSAGTDDSGREPAFEGSTPDDGGDDSVDPVDVDGTDADTDASDGSTVEADLDNPEEFELDDEVREQVENEFGTEFETAADVGGPGEADIETPTPETAESADEASAADREDGGDDDDESAVAAGTEPADEGDPGVEADSTDPADSAVDAATEEPAAADESSEDEVLDDGPAGDEPADTEPTDDDGGMDEPAETADPEEAVVAVMQELDDGSGADREAVVDRVVEEYGLTAAEADDGIQSALMSGECYEPDDDTLKPI